MIMNAFLKDLLCRYPVLVPCAGSMQAAFDLLTASFQAQGKLLLCGNGGSAADCDHIVGELMKSFLRARPILDAHRDGLRQMGAEGEALSLVLQGGLPCVALTGHTALNFAVSNDVASNAVFAQQVYVLGKPGDVLWGLSTSGNSVNVVNAFRVARVLGVRTIAFTGEAGGKLAKMADVAVCAPSTSTPEVQELHLPIYHALCAALEEHFFGSQTRSIAD